MFRDTGKRTNTVLFDIFTIIEKTDFIKGERLVKIMTKLATFYSYTLIFIKEQAPSNAWIFF